MLRCGFLIPLFALSLVLGGCSDGSDGDPGARGPAGESITGDKGDDGKGFSLSVAEAHEVSVPKISEATIHSVNVNTSGATPLITVNFSIDGYTKNQLNVEFTMARWNEAEGAWQSLLHTIRNRYHATNYPDAVPVLRAGNIRTGVSRASSTESFTYTFNPITNPEDLDFDNTSGDLNSAAYIAEQLAKLDQSWSADGLYRVAVVSRENAVVRFNALADFNGLGTIHNDLQHAVLDVNSCNTCHGERVVFQNREYDGRNTPSSVHGNSRFEPNLCLTCHNDFTFGSRESAADDWAEISLLTMIHKIHAGVPDYTVDGYEYGAQVRYPDWTFGRGRNNTVNLNRGTANCTSCHQETAPAVHEDWNIVTHKACLSCHEGASVADAFTGSGFNDAHQATDRTTNCIGCHVGGAIRSADQYHGVTSKLAEIAAASSYNIVVFSVEDAVATVATVPPVVTWGIKDGAGNPVDLEETQALGFFEVAIGWGYGDDFTNDGVNRTTTGSQGHPFHVIAGVGNTDLIETNTVAVTTLPPLPANAEEGRFGFITIMPLFNDEDGGLTIDNEKVKPNTFVGTFDLGAAPVDTFGARRSIVDINKCNDCHGSMARHETWANSDINGCIACHNAGSLSRNVNVGLTNGHIQGSVDMMFMVHAIHGLGEKREVFERRYTAQAGYSYRNYPVTYPNTILDCNACHVKGTEYLFVDFRKRLGVIADNMKVEYNDVDDPRGVNSPTSSVCFSCHESGKDVQSDSWLNSHMTSSSGNMYGDYNHEYYTQPRGAESCIYCHK